LPLPLPLPLALLPLALAPTLLSLLALLALSGLAGICEVAPRFLKTVRGTGEVAIDVDVVLRALQRLAEPVQCLPGGVSVALGEVLGGLAERGAGRATCLVCHRLEAREVRGKLAALGVRHLIEALADVSQVLGRRLRVAALVRVLPAGRRTGQRPAQRGQRGGPLLVRRVELRANVGLGARHAGEIGLEIVRVLPELT
jgi:hypothetical protein